jgi:hypothetical protein
MAAVVITVAVSMVVVVLAAVVFAVVGVALTATDYYS